MAKFVNEIGKIAILISHGFGAGWSTWNRDFADFMLMDKTLVEMRLRNATESEVKTYLDDALNGEYVCTGGWNDVTVEYLSEGTPFRVTEYDGNESLMTVQDLSHVA